MKYKEYTDKKGRIIWAGQGIGDKAWFTCWCIPGKKGSHRLVSPDLPIRHNRKQAQDDLDAYAAKKGFKIYKPAPVKPEPQPVKEPVKEIAPPAKPAPPDIDPWEMLKRLDRLLEHLKPKKPQTVPRPRPAQKPAQQPAPEQISLF